jgi:hypothetical protein
LAALLGRSIAEVETLGSDEINAWIAFDALYGLPDAYFVTGRICALMAQLWGDGKGPRVGPADFIPYFAAARGGRDDPRAIFERIRALKARAEGVRSADGPVA